MLSIGLVLLGLAVVAVLLVACLQKTIFPSNEMTDPRVVRLQLDALETTLGGFPVAAESPR